MEDIRRLEVVTNNPEVPELLGAAGEGRVQFVPGTPLDVIDAAELRLQQSTARVGAVAVQHSHDAGPPIPPLGEGGPPIRCAGVSRPRKAGAVLRPRRSTHRTGGTSPFSTGTSPEDLRPSAPRPPCLKRNNRSRTGKERQESPEGKRALSRYTPNLWEAEGPVKAAPSAGGSPHRRGKSARLSPSQSGTSCRRNSSGGEPQGPSRAFDPLSYFDFSSVSTEVAAHGVEGLLADIMLDPAGI